MTDFLKSMAIMACSCVSALILAALLIEPPPVPPAPAQLILTPAPEHAYRAQLYPLNDGREPVDMPRFKPE